MFSKLIFAAIAAQALLASADPNPTAPGPGDVFNQGANCAINWDLDTTGAWTQMTVELMTGDNFKMVHLADVGTFDATKVGTYSYPCPTVTPNSAIYFYRFKQAGVNGTYYTTRFAIADASGATTPPIEEIQSNGAKIPWGTGEILGGAGDGSSSVSNSVPSSSSSPSSSPVSTPLPSSPGSSTPSNSGSHSPSSSIKPSSSSSSNSTTSGNSTSDNSGAIAIASRGAGVFVALAAVLTLMF
jgi:hypothetical protein